MTEISEYLQIIKHLKSIEGLLVVLIGLAFMIVVILLRKKDDAD